jgi:hypothetical protein
MKSWWMLLVAAVVCLNVHSAGASIVVCEVGLDLHDLMTTDSNSPFEVWRKLRPQDFIGAPTVWQVLA